MKTCQLTQLRYVIVTLALAGSACGANGDREATALALGESIAQTATAAGAGFDANVDLMTAEAEATARSLSASSTREADSALSEQDLRATEAVLAPVMAALPAYGIDPSEGRIGWVHPPERLEVEGYMQYDYANRYITTIASDFVVSGDITWNTSTGLAGCGFVIRSDGNEEALNQYLLIATRGGDGRVIFSTMVDGDVKNAVDRYAFGLDPAFEWRNDTTNRLTVVGRGNVFTLYTNGARIGEVVAGEAPLMPIVPSPPVPPPPGASTAARAAYGEALEEHEAVVEDIQANFRARLAEFREEIPIFERGFVAMVALSESGRTVCQFDNAWLWLLDG